MIVMHEISFVIFGFLTLLVIKDLIFLDNLLVS